jgi:transposase-like protein
MSKRTRRTFQASEKLAIIRKHLIEKVPISDLCETHNIQPTQYYDWQKKFFENGELALSVHKGKERGQKNRYEKQITQLEDQIVKKNEVVAELLQEHVQLKKELGEP